MAALSLEEMIYLTGFQRRSVLGDISSESLQLRGSPSHGNASFTNEGYPSPEEEIIYQRSHRRNSTPSSRYCLQYDTDFLQILPAKKPVCLSKKRVLSSPTKAVSGKRKCVRQTDASTPEMSSCVPFQTKLHTFNTSQLVSVVDALSQCHPEIDQVVRKLITVSDLKTLDKKLATLKLNVYRSLPTIRFGSGRDASCYKRAKVHLSAFKKTCIEEGKLLLLSQDWDTLIKYVLLAWKYVHALPYWDDASHNKGKRQCFQTLAAQCMVAIKRKSFDRKSLMDLRNRLQQATSCSKEIEPCLCFVDKALVSNS